MGMGWEETVMTAKHLFEHLLCAQTAVLVYGKELRGQSQDFEFQLQH